MESIENHRIARPFDDVLNLITSKLAESDGTAHEGRITEPFDAIIDKRSITVENLRRYTTLPIECTLYHSTQGRLTISTGTRSGGAYDFGDYFQNMERGLEKLTPEELQTDPRLQEYSNLVNAKELKTENMRFGAKYNAHQHPGGTRAPSFGDVLFSSYSPNVDVEMIFTEVGVLFYRATDDAYQKYIAWRRVREEVLTEEGMQSECERLGIIKGYVDFDSPRMESVVAFMRGEKKWDDIKEVVAASLTY